MKKFKFRLEKILQYKNRIEEEKKNLLAQQISAYNKVQVQMDNALKTKNKILQEMSLKIAQVDFIRFAGQSLDGIRQTIKNGKLEQARIQVLIDEARAIYIKARQEKKAFEKLREKALEKWKYEQKKANAKIMEEAASRLWSEGKLREFEWT